MIFASDLDRTLIYTSKFLNEDLMKKVVPVDFKEDRIISYMLSESFNQLKEISEKAIFIPATTRISPELSRIKGFNEIRMPYAVTTNGGRVFVNGKEDLLWTNKIQKELDSMEVPPSKLEQFLNKQFFASLECRINFVEDTYISITFKPEDKTYVESCIDEVVTNLKSLGFDYGYTGNKLFILPANVRKKHALNYILENIDSQRLITAGDSLMDLEMVDMAKTSFVPKHGEIVIKNQTPIHSITTETEGLFAGLEITEKVLSLLK